MGLFTTQFGQYHPQIWLESIYTLIQIYYRIPVLRK